MKRIVTSFTGLNKELNSLSLQACEGCKYLVILFNLRWVYPFCGRFGFIDHNGRGEFQCRGDKIGYKVQ